MEATHEDQIIDIKQKHVEERQKLKEHYEKYLKEQEAIKTEKRDLERERDKEEERMKKAKLKKSKVKALLEEKIKQINMLEQEREEVTDKLKKRETDLYKYKFKIKDL